MVDKVLRPKVLALNVDDATASRNYKHWKATCDNYIAALPIPDAYKAMVTVTFPNDMMVDLWKRNVLCNLVDPDIWEDIKDCTTYEDSIDVLTGIFVKTPSEVFARYRLLSTKQGAGQSLEGYKRELERFSRECNFTDVSAIRNREDFILSAFIAGINNSDIRKRLLEEKSLTFSDAYNLAVTLHEGHKEAKVYDQAVGGMNLENLNLNTTAQPNSVHEQSGDTAVNVINSACGQCGRNFCNQGRCPAIRSECFNCGERGHWEALCKKSRRSRNFNGRRGNARRGTSRASHRFAASTSTAGNTNVATQYNQNVPAYHNHVSHSCNNYITGTTTPACLNFSTVISRINGHECETLIDSGSSLGYIHIDKARSMNLTIYPTDAIITLADIHSQSKLFGTCYVDIELNRTTYKNVKLGVFGGLCTDVLLGGDFLQRHKQVIFRFNTDGGDLIIDKSSNSCAVTRAKIDCPSLFANLKPNCTPIATKSRRYNSEDTLFIRNTVNSWLKHGICRPSQSPWRAQVLVVKTNDEQGNVKKRVCQDYSQTINLYTELDSYPIPSIADMVNNLAKYKLYATFDLKAAYHQIPLREDDIPFTAFEADGRLYEMCVIPFGVMNGGPVFQRQMDDIVTEDNLTDTFPYFDNITIGGYNQKHLNANIQAFLSALKKRKMTLNDSKKISSVTELPMTYPRLSCW